MPPRSGYDFGGRGRKTRARVPPARRHVDGLYRQKYLFQCRIRATGHSFVIARSAASSAITPNVVMPPVHCRGLPPISIIRSTLTPASRGSCEPVSVPSTGARLSASGSRARAPGEFRTYRRSRWHAISSTTSRSSRAPAGKRYRAAPPGARRTAPPAVHGAGGRRGGAAHGRMKRFETLSAAPLKSGSA